MLGDSSYGWLQIRPLSGRLSHLHPDLIGPPLGRDQCRDDPLANDAPTSMRHRPQYFDGPHSAGAHLESKLSLRLRCTSPWAVARATAPNSRCVVAVLAAGTALAALAALAAALAALAAGRFRTQPAPSQGPSKLLLAASDRLKPRSEATSSVRPTRAPGMPPLVARSIEVVCYCSAVRE
jgi:hypothetical protein